MSLAPPPLPLTKMSASVMGRAVAPPVMGSQVLGADSPVIRSLSRPVSEA